MNLVRPPQLVLLAMTNGGTTAGTTGNGLAPGMINNGPGDTTGEAIAGMKIIIRMLCRRGSQICLFMFNPAVSEFLFDFAPSLVYFCSFHVFKNTG